MLLVRLGLVAGVFLVGGEAAFLDRDSHQYLTPARQLALEGRYWNDDAPEIFRPPGTAVLLWAGFRLGSPILTGVLLQARLGTAAAALVLLATRQLSSDPRAPLLAALLFGVDPVQLTWGARIMAETLTSHAPRR